MRYVHEDAATRKLEARSMECFATPEGQAHEAKAAAAFRKKHPDVPVAQFIKGVDEVVEGEIYNLLLRDYTADAAVYAVCVQRPELYARSCIESTATGSASGQQSEGGGSGKAGRGSKTPEEREQGLKRQLEQKDREIANWKAGKSGNKGGKGQPHYGYGDWSANSQWQPAKGKGGGPPVSPGRHFCPDYLCKDYNFASAGCKYGEACKKKHLCCVCGKEHPARGNH